MHWISLNKIGMFIIVYLCFDMSPYAFKRHSSKQKSTTWHSWNSFVFVRDCTLQIASVQRLDRSFCPVRFHPRLSTERCWAKRLKSPVEITPSSKILKFVYACDSGFTWSKHDLNIAVSDCVPAPKKSASCVRRFLRLLHDHPPAWTATMPLMASSPGTKRNTDRVHAHTFLLHALFAAVQRALKAKSSDKACSNKKNL